jgi:hypothetical protein
MVVVTIAIMTARGFLPTYHLLHFGWWSPWCQVVGSGVFLLVLFCWQEVGRLSTCRGQLLFLDRACINQLDDDLKQRGIEHLAAFVYYSWSMLICYSDEYLQRLWTVYEVASFLMLHPGSALHVRHAFFAKFIISGVALVFVYNIVFHALHVPGALENSPVSVDGASFILIVVLMVPASVAMSIMMLTMARIRTKISERTKQFRFADAKCFCEDDRSTVQRNIIAAMKYHGRADPQGSDADIIGDFESMVQSEVPKLFAASLGRNGFPYHFGVCLHIPFCLQSIDYACAQFHNGIAARVICFQLAYSLTLVFAGMPLCLALGIRGAACVYSPARSRYVVNVFLLTSFTITFLAGSFFLLRRISELATQGSGKEEAAFVAALALFALSTLLMYRPIRYKVHHRRLRRPES